MSGGSTARAPRYIVGIDLGTTNSSVAYVELADPQRQVIQLPILQLVAEATVGERSTLPSFLYLGGEHDLAPGALALPWDAQRPYAVGEFARLQGARVPGRMVSSAKSWLCHGGVDREAAILPWGAPADVTKISPVDVSSRFLQHLRETWAQQFPAAPLEEQDVLLTVPASFDEVARELTVEAAKRAGLPRVVLLEEPQAAFYSWLHHHEEGWQQLVENTRSIVVVDVGGGTTDFSLIRVGRDDGNLTLERRAVGDHLLLGGDNIDVALARLLEPRLGDKLDTQRWHALVSHCRAAKETLLGAGAPAEVPIRLVGRGRSVVGGVVSATLTRHEVEELVLGGFFPPTALGDLPRRTQRVALQEFGLPFAAEAEVSRHLAAFLTQHGGTGDDRLPDAVLFNGGALKPPAIRQRIGELLASWSGAPPQVLESPDLDLAVARGAAYYGLVRRGRGIRIGGGTARSYYVGLSAPETSPRVSDGATTSEGAAPGQGAVMIQALCLAPRGMREGEEIEITDRDLEVVTNRPVSFPLYASSTRLGDVAGELIEAPRESLSILPPIRTVLRFGKKLVERQIPVHLMAHLTEIGTLEVSCRSLSTEHRWRLQFQLRDQNAPIESSDDENAQHSAEAMLPEPAMEAAIEALRRVFPAQAGGPAGDPVSLGRTLEQCLEMGKDAWPLSAIRRLWDALWEGQGQRATSADHEARWLNLCGFLLRPGYGAQVDDMRIQHLWRLKSAGPIFAKAAQVRAEWWNLWKRIAGGLNRQQQMQLYTEVAPHLLPKLKAKAKGSKPGPQEIREHWQLMASCERLSAEIKADLGGALLASVLKGKASDTDLWALGRLGARAAMYGPLNGVVAPAIVAGWVETILAARWEKPEPYVFLLVQLARCVGDRERDLDEALRRRIAQRVVDLPHGRRAARLVSEVVALEAQEKARILDEALPAGLQLRVGGS